MYRAIKRAKIFKNLRPFLISMGIALCAAFLFQVCFFVFLSFPKRFYFLYSSANFANSGSARRMVSVSTQYAIRT